MTSAIAIVAWFLRRLGRCAVNVSKHPPIRALAVCCAAAVASGYCLGERRRQERQYQAWERDGAVREALAEEARILLPDPEHCTLLQGVELLRQQVDVAIDIETKLLELPIQPGHLVSREGTGQGIFQGPLDEVLNQMLGTVEGSEGVGYRLEQGRIVIRGGPEYPAAALTKTYDTPVHSPGRLNLDARDIAHLITTCISPDCWDDVGGPDTALHSPGAVTVAASSQTHRQIALMLKQLATLSAEPPSPEPVAFLDAGYPYDREAGPSRLLTSLSHADDFDYKETTLKNFLASISTRFEFPIVVATKKLEEAAIDLETPVEIKMPSVSLRSCLRNALGELGLTYMLGPEGLVITTPEDAGSRLIFLLYPVQDLLRHNSSVEAEKLIDVITSSVEPDSWDDVGGPGSVESIGSGWLLISQTQEGHEHTLEFLNQLRHDVPRASRPRPELASREQAARRIQKVLCGPEILDLPPLPLDQFAGALQQRMGVPVVMATKRLEEAAVDPKSVDICLDSFPQPFWHQLGEGLRSYHLSFCVREDCLVITTDEDAACRLEREIVDIRDLTVIGSGHASEQMLIHLIQHAVDRDSWEDHGGAASIVAFRDCLVIHHGSHSLFEIREFLSWLRANRNNLPTLAEVDSLNQQSEEFHRLTRLSQSSPDRWLAAYLSFVLNPEFTAPQPVLRQAPACYSSGCFCF